MPLFPSFPSCLIIIRWLNSFVCLILVPLYSLALSLPEREHYSCQGLQWRNENDYRAIFQFIAMKIDFNFSWNMAVVCVVVLRSRWLNTRSFGDVWSEVECWNLCQMEERERERAKTLSQWKNDTRHDVAISAHFTLWNFVKMRTWKMCDRVDVKCFNLSRQQV